jgi:hypothetical protein
MRWAHLVHVNGELGDVDYEKFLESKDEFQLTYRFLRDTATGDHVAELKEDGQWYIVGGHPGYAHLPYSDIIFQDEEPIPVAMSETDYIEGITRLAAEAVRDGAILIDGVEDQGFTGVPNEFWISHSGRRFLVKVVLDSAYDLQEVRRDS